MALQQPLHTGEAGCLCMATRFVHADTMEEGVTSHMGEARTDMLVLHLPAPALP